MIRLNGSPIMRGGGFVLQPFLETFRDLEDYDILYFVQPQPGFAGLREYECAALSVRLVADGGAESTSGNRQHFFRPYRYVVQNHDHTGAVPVIPLTQPASDSARASDRASTGSLGSGASMAGSGSHNVVYWPIVLLAAGSGLFVYGALRVLARR
jgi:hypothetical protein